MQRERKDMQDPGQACLKLWSHLSMKNALMPLEKESLQEDPYTLAEAQLTAATTYGQQLESNAADEKA